MLSFRAGMLLVSRGRGGAGRAGLGQGDLPSPRGKEGGGNGLQFGWAMTPQHVAVLMDVCLPMLFVFSVRSRSPRNTKRP